MNKRTRVEDNQYKLINNKKNKLYYPEKILFIEDVKCNICNKYEYLHSSQDKKNCYWKPIYNDLSSFISKLSLL